ncbi:hypothetical protein BGZ83_002818 [Gryganskiella cystojenkinii]|nr:hypothetical protein BGZ83_002818 [Gryganskiella cystojenkinii]
MMFSLKTVLVSAMATVFLSAQVVNGMSVSCNNFGQGHPVNCIGGVGSNLIYFGNIEGCTSCYCAHVTEPSNNEWKIWVDNCGTGCSCLMPMNSNNAGLYGNVQSCC